MVKFLFTTTFCRARWTISRRRWSSIAPTRSRPGCRSFISPMGPFARTWLFVRVPLPSRRRKSIFSWGLGKSRIAASPTSTTPCNFGSKRYFSIGWGNVGPRKRMSFNDRYLLRYKFLDVPKMYYIIIITERNSCSPCSGTTGSTDTMNVGF